MISEYSLRRLGLHPRSASVNGCKFVQSDFNHQLLKYSSLRSSFRRRTLSNPHAQWWKLSPRADTRVSSPQIKIKTRFAFLLYWRKEFASVWILPKCYLNQISSYPDIFSSETEWNFIIYWIHCVETRAEKAMASNVNAASWPFISVSKPQHRFQSLGTYDSTHLDLSNPCSSWNSSWKRIASASRQSNA